MSEKFERLITQLCDSMAFEKRAGLFIIVVLTAVPVFIGFLIFHVVILLFCLFIASVFGICGYYQIAMNRGNMKGGQFWIHMIKNNPQNIIWIKPITVSHDIGMVFTLYEEKKFQLLTIDGLSVTLDCNSKANQLTFFEGILNHLPHAHIGYSLKVEDLYDYKPADFINALKTMHLYTPITSYLEKTG
jgi:hypothetical protein